MKEQGTIFADWVDLPVALGSIEEFDFTFQ